MAVPYLGGVMKGWTRKTDVKIITQAVVNHEVTEIENDLTFPANFQPMPAATVNRKPEEQRTWTWWSLIIRDKSLLLVSNDIIEDASGQRFRIEKANDWRTSGFTKYEAIEDFEAST